MRKTLVLFAIIASSFSFAQDAVVLKRTAKEGDTAKFSLTVNTEFGGMKIKYSAKVVEKVTKVDADGGFTVSSEQQDGVLEMNGSEQPAPAGVGAAVSTIFRADGTVADIKGDEVDPAAFRMGNLQAFFYPKEAVNVGSKWETIVKGDKEKGSVDLKATFEILAREKVGTHECFKVAIESKEQAGDEPAGSKGFAWVEITTGSVVKAEGEWTNVPIAGQSINGQVKMEIID